MNLKKFLKWSLVLTAILAYKQMQASEGQYDYTKPALSVVTEQHHSVENLVF
jgi:hypothetical protein